MTEEKDLGMFEIMLQTIKAMPENTPQEVADKQEAIRKFYQDYEGMSNIIDQELSEADFNYQTQMPDGRQAGQVYVAANPLEHLSAALRQGYGGYQRKKAIDELRKLSEDKSSAMSEILGSGVFKNDGAQPGFQSVTNPSMHVSQAPMSQALRNQSVSNYGAHVPQFQPSVSKAQPALQPRAQGPVPVQQGVPMNVNAQQRQPMMNAGPMTRDISQLDEETLRYLTNMF